jgi:hypothetical protein
MSETKLKVLKGRLLQHPQSIPPIGSPWHTRDGRNVFVSDVVLLRDGTTKIILVSERGRSHHCTLADLGRIFRRGYAR